MLLGFFLGLVVGITFLVLDRRRYDAKLKRLLARIEDRQPLSTLGYSAQLASAIGEQQAQLDRLMQQNREFRQLLQNAPVGYLQLDDENRLLWCNQKAQEYLDIDRGDYAEPRLLLAVVRSFELDQLVERTRQAQTVCEARWTFNSISTDPSNYLERPAYPLQGYGVPLNQGQVGVFLENNQEAVLMAQQRDRWISDVAHELKTPLTSIRLVAETLQSRVEPKLLSWVERLLKEVIRLSKLVDGVLSMNSLEQGHSPLQDEADTDLVPLIYAAWQSVEPLAKLKQLELTYQGPHKLVATVNASLIHGVLFNLLSNAIKYSPAHQTIQLRLGLAQASGARRPPASALREGSLNMDARHILLEVIDAGVGFAEKDLAHVFDRFYRGDPARSRDQNVSSPDKAVTEGVEMAELTSSGSGLGLAIVRQVAMSHQGWVEAKNDPETGGGCLSVWLPNKRLVETAPVAQDLLIDSST